MTPAERQRQIRSQRLNDGLCPECGGPRDRDVKLCRKCQTEQSKRRKDWRDRRIAANLKPPRWRILAALSLGPLSFEELQAKAKMRRTGDALGVLLTELLTERAIESFSSSDVRFYRLRKTYPAKAFSGSDKGVESGPVGAGRIPAE